MLFTRSLQSTHMRVQVSEGDCRTRVASTADFWRDCMAEADREVRVPTVCSMHMLEAYMPIRP